MSVVLDFGIGFGSLWVWRGLLVYFTVQHRSLGVVLVGLGFLLSDGSKILARTRYWMPFYFIYLMLFVNQTPLVN